MESLLPSEIARLVLGYLEEQKCDEAAKSFLETCTHLQEIRTVISSGRRFSTRVNGFTLSDVLDTFCSASVIIHERMSKVSDCDQLKHCGDLLEQLKFLVDGSRGQRFFVNINVPPTSQTSGGSPIISSSMRKRHHSGSDRDRSKRANKSHSNAFVKSSESVSSQLSCNAVETTPLEHLPGNSGSEKADVLNEKASVKFHEHGLIHCSSTVTEAVGCHSLPEDRRESRGDGIQSTSLPDFQELRNLDADTANLRRSPEKQHTTYEKCSAATDTEELTRFTNTEVQTTPYDAVESETELTDEPVENLSLLTKELLNRTELQERIAENINKAILPADVSQRDASMTESLGGEMNTSIMRELDNAIKSIVIATESDPVFTQFLDDIIGPSCENDTSPDEDDHQQGRTDGFADDNPDLAAMDPSAEGSSQYEKKSTTEAEATEVPLKNRLRSSSSQQIVRPDEDRPSSQKSNRREDNALEDMNAAAVLSIINVNNKLDEEPLKLDVAGGLLDLNVEPDRNVAIASREAEPVVDDPPLKPYAYEAIAKDATANVPSQEACSSLDGKSSRKPNARKSRAPKQNPRVAIPEAVPEALSEVVTTLIYCPNVETSSLIGAPSTLPAKSRFVPIAPKTDDAILIPPKEETIHLKAVIVPKKVSKSTAPKPGAAIEQHQAPTTTCRQTRRHTASLPVRKTRIAKQVVTASAANILNTDLEPTFPASELAAAQKLTLYGENSAGAVLDETEVPAVHDDALISSFTGTGLSPYLKSKSAPELANPKLLEISDKLPNSEEASAPTISFEPAAEKNHEAPAPAMSFELATTEHHEASNSTENSYDLLTKRTPRTLLKSRSKNHRLSCSTPRRSRHVRALDFTTPTKIVKTGRRMSTNESMEFSRKSPNFAKSLFKSPPFVGSSTTPKKPNSPAKDRGTCDIPPIATRSPAPKLMGGWDKCNGIGMILGSPSSTSCSPVKKPAPLKVITESWDAALRRSLQLPDDSQPKATKKPPPRKSQSKRRRGSRRRPTIGSRSEVRESLSPDKKSEADDVGLAPENAPAIEESLSVDVVDEPVENSKNIELAKASERPSKKAQKEAETIEETAAASNSDEVRRTCEVSRTTTNTKKSVEIVTSNDCGSKTEKTVKKKYAQVRTITTSVTRIERGQSGFELVSGAIERPEKSSSELSRTEQSEASRQISHMPDMLDLETPRKIDNAFGIPPTPRLLSPSSSMTTPFGLQVGEDSGKMRSFITTPEFPPTPSIAVTPKQTSESAVDSSKKEPYYHPSSELKDPRLPRNDHSRHEMSLPLLGMIASTRTDKCVTDISVQVAQGLQACTTGGNKLEVTQFAVIKDNLSREETFREIKISTSSKDHPDNGMLAEANEICVASSIAESDKLRVIADANSSGSTVDDDSSDSDSSDSSSDTSSSSSSSSSSDASATNTSAVMSVTERYSEVTTGKICTNTSQTARKPAGSDQSAAVNVDADNVQTEDRTDAISRVENESSPCKVFAIAKTEEDLKETIKETPAKDDSLLSEAVISETPSSSKVGIETLTNLNTKISALITSQDREFSKSNSPTVDKANARAPQKKSLPKVVSVERIFPDVTIALKPAPVIDTLYSAMRSRSHGVLQPSAMSNAKLSRQLEEKRLRIVAKVKENENPPAHRRRIKAVALPKSRRSIVEKKKSLADEAKHDDVSVNESHKEEENIVEVATKVEKKKSQMLKDLFGESLMEEPETGNGEESMEESEESSKITDEDDKLKLAEDRVDEERNDDSAERRKDDEKSRVESHLAERSKGKSESETISENTKKEECAEQRTVESKTAAKSRVDLVKRDLFSDEESSDQRTTRSRTRQSSDTHKSDSVESQASVISDSRRNRSATPKEDMPGVLECLELVPTTKNDAAEEEEEDDEEEDEAEAQEEEAEAVNVMEISQHHAEYHFIYDDAVPTKRRKRKYSSSDLEFLVQVEISDDNYRMCSKLMTATPYEEMFNISPPRRRRGPAKKKTLARIVNTKTKSIFKDIDDKPLATSSPVLKTVPPKVVGKVAKSPAKKSDTHQTDGKKKIAVKTEKTQSEHEKPNPKSRKRKASVSNESEQMDKKSRTTEPSVLSKLDNEENIAKLLAQVHGPP